jgi:hypothetical protein
MNCICTLCTPKEQNTRPAFLCPFYCPRRLKGKAANTKQIPLTTWKSSFLLSLNICTPMYIYDMNGAQSDTIIFISASVCVPMLLPKKVEKKHRVIQIYIHFSQIILNYLHMYKKLNWRIKLWRHVFQSTHIDNYIYISKHLLIINT